MTEKTQAPKKEHSAMKKNDVIALRISKESKDKLKEIAEQHNLSLSAYILSKVYE